MNRILGLFENAFQPFRTDPAPEPPRTLGAFLRWVLWEFRWLVLALMLATLAYGVLDAWAAWYLGVLVDMAAESGPERFVSDNFWALLGGAALFCILRPLAYSVQSAMMSLAIQPNLGTRVAWRLHRHTLGQSLGFFQDDFAGRIASKQVQTFEAVILAVLDSVTGVGLFISFLASMTVVFIAIDPRLALATALWIGCYILWVMRCVPRVRKAARRRAESKAGATGRFVDSFTNIATVKLFAHAGREEDFAREGLTRYLDAGREFGREAVTMRFGLALLNAFGALAMVMFAVQLWRMGQASIGDLGAAVALILRATHMSSWVAWSALGVFSNLGVIEDGAGTLGVRHTLSDQPGAQTLERARGEIRFENVDFRYGDHVGGVAGLDLTVAPGERIGLVGRSGAGKSTLVNLLLRLHDVEAGRVALDGHDIRGLTQASLRRHIAMVTQDTAMFNRSALDNILYGRPEASEAEAIKAAEQARALDFIADLRDPDGRKGLAAHIGERGVKLSGGQRQRIAIARAILKDAPVLVLDEATSALDSEVEAEIQGELMALMEGKTVIAIAHRLSTIAHLDRIVVMDAGRVVEQGSHEALLESGGLYAGFWKRQSGGFLGVEAAE